MNRIVAILFAILILLQPFNKVLILCSFKINQAEIAKTLCINRTKPQLHCNGKCVLAKRLKVAEDSEKKDLPKKLKEDTQVLYCFEPCQVVLHHFCYAHTRQPAPLHYQAPFAAPALRGIFRPPKA